MKSLIFCIVQVLKTFCPLKGLREGGGQSLGDMSPKSPFILTPSLITLSGREICHIEDCQGQCLSEIVACPGESIKIK